MRGVRLRRRVWCAAGPRVNGGRFLRRFDWHSQGWYSVEQSSQTSGAAPSEQHFVQSKSWCICDVEGLLSGGHVRLRRHPAFDLVSLGLEVVCLSCAGNVICSGKRSWPSKPIALTRMTRRPLSSLLGNKCRRSCSNGHASMPVQGVVSILLLVQPGNRTLSDALPVVYDLVRRHESS